MRLIPALFLLLFPVCTANAQVGAAAAPSYFGTLEVKRENLAPFPKWTDAMQREARDRAGIPADCRPSFFTRCQWDDWKRLLADARASAPLAQLELVNRFINKHPYITDPVNWGVDDYWTSIGQFFAKDGDCEDYAIAKFYTLRELGWDNEQMRIVVLQDQNLKVAHAILVVQAGERTLVLDNQINQVVEAAAIRHYRPIFSLNETHWWLHRPPQ